jgi:hypothetical protein
MTMETVMLVIDERFAFEAAANLLAVIIHPDRPAERKQFVDAAIFLALRRAANEDPRWAAQPQPIRPALLLQDIRAAETRWQKGMKVFFEQRLVAGTLALPNILQALGGEVRLAGDRPVSLNNLADDAAQVLAELRGRGAKGGDAANVKTRSWKPSKPVLHLCVAIVAEILMRRQNIATPTCSEIMADLENPEILRRWVRLGREWRPILASNDVTIERQVDVMVDEDGVVSKIF